MGLLRRLPLLGIPLAIVGATWPVTPDPVDNLIRQNEAQWQDEDLAVLELAKLSRLYGASDAWRKCPVGEYDPNAAEALLRVARRDPDRLLRLGATADPVPRGAILLTLSATRPEGSSALLRKATSSDPDPWIRHALAARR